MDIIKSFHNYVQLFKTQPCNYKCTYLTYSPVGSTFFPTSTGQYQGTCSFTKVLPDSHSQLPTFKLHSASNWSSSKTYNKHVLILSAAVMLQLKPLLVTLYLPCIPLPSWPKGIPWSRNIQQPDVLREESNPLSATDALLHQSMEIQWYPEREARHSETIFTRPKNCSLPEMVTMHICH